MHIPVHFHWLPGYIDVAQIVLDILTVAGIFPDRPHIFQLSSNDEHISCLYFIVIFNNFLVDIKGLLKIFYVLWDKNQMSLSYVAVKLPTLRSLLVQKVPFNNCSFTGLQILIEWLKHFFIKSLD